jgi:hypothetical protein
MIKINNSFENIVQFFKSFINKLKYLLTFKNHVYIYIYI